jgi:hypothetical protein
MKNDLNTIWNVKCSYRAIMANGEICSMTFNCTRLCGTECHYKQEGELKTEKENCTTECKNLVRSIKLMLTYQPIKCSACQDVFETEHGLRTHIGKFMNNHVI